MSHSKAEYSYWSIHGDLHRRFDGSILHRTPPYYKSKRQLPCPHGALHRLKTCFAENLYRLLMKSRNKYISLFNNLPQFAYSTTMLVVQGVRRWFVGVSQGCPVVAAGLGFNHWTASRWLTAWVCSSIHQYSDGSIDNFCQLLVIRSKSVQKFTQQVFL